MHGDVPTKQKAEPTKLRKANEHIAEAKYLSSGQLFDEFWREGEVALLFGPAGAGKSILATQIAECIARGCGIEGFKMTAMRQKVLYVDLKLSARQHKRRYAKPRQSKSEIYRFSENLYHDTPSDVENLADWLREKITGRSIRAVIIDDISAVKRSGDGIRDTLPLMRDLKKLTRELDISVLVIVGSREPGPGRLISEADLQRARVLSEVSDSTFAIGLHPRAPETRYLVQVRSMEAQVWNYDNAPMCVFQRSDNGFLGFQFDKRFIPQIDEAKRLLVCDIKRRHDSGASYRVIADELGISHSTVKRRLKEWRPEFERPDEFQDEAEEPSKVPGGNPGVIPGESNGGNGATPGVPAAFPSDDEIDEWDECDIEKPVWLGEEKSEENVIELSPAEYMPDPAATPESARSILLAAGCELKLDAYGKEIFVESEDELGKPVLAYQFNAQGRLTCCRYNGWGRTGYTVNGPVCWLQSG